MAKRKKKATVLAEVTEIGVLYTTREVAERLRVNARTVQEWIRTKQLPAVRYGRNYRVRAEDLVRFGQETATSIPQG